MASPISITLDEAKTCLAWTERALKRSLRPDELQASISDPVQMERIIAFIRAGAPEFQGAFLPFEESKSHRKVWELLGRDFQGVMAAQRFLRPFTAEELEEHREIRLFGLTEEETLRMLEEGKGTFGLCAAHRGASLLDVHARRPERFTADPDAPWFREQKQRDKWSGQGIPAPWIHYRIEVVPGSANKDVKAQVRHLERNYPKERSFLPCEFAYAAPLRYQETRHKMCSTHWVRFPVQTAGGGWVGADWVGDRLDFFDWGDCASDSIASGSVRTS